MLSDYLNSPISNIGLSSSFKSGNWDRNSLFSLSIILCGQKGIIISPLLCQKKSIGSIITFSANTIPLNVLDLPVAFYTKAKLCNSSTPKLPIKLMNI